MSNWSRSTRGRITGYVEHTCRDVPCSDLVAFTRVVPLKSDGMVRLEGVRHDGAPIHHYVHASELTS